MAYSKDNLNPSRSKRTLLEAEIQALREDVIQLRLENAELKAKPEQQEAIEEKFEENKSRFEAIFN